jgi:flavodoxin
LKYGIKYAIFYGMTASVAELIQAATDARRIAQKAIQLAVREARAADWSWDQISAALGGKPNGETLRRNFGAGE